MLDENKPVGIAIIFAELYITPLNCNKLPPRLQRDENNFLSSDHVCAPILTYERREMPFPDLRLAIAGPAREAVPFIIRRNVLLNKIFQLFSGDVLLFTFKGAVQAWQNDQCK